MSDVSDRSNQSMRQAVARVMGEPAKAPQALRAQVAAMVEAQGRAKPQATVLGRIGRWVPLAAAAMLLIAAGSGFFLSGITSPTPEAEGDAILSAALVDRFGARHELCTGDVSRLYQATRFPDQIEALPDALATYFHESVGEVRMDLSSLGYRYRATGVCRLPGRGAAHITYVSGTDALSLWMRRDDGRLQVEEGRLYAAGQETRHPMLIWRRGEMIYYLVGDAPERVERAAAILRTSG